MEGDDPAGAAETAAAAAAAAAAAESGEGRDAAVTSYLFEASLLLASCALFYKFAWVYYRERLFPHHSFATATVASTEKSCGGGVLSLKAAGRAFSLTFALSCCIFELIILEIAGLLNPASSPLAWRACLGLMVLGLHVVLPFLLAFACLGEMGLGRRPACVGALALLSGALFVASDVGHQDVAAAAAAATSAHEGKPPVFSLEACLARVGVVGVASLALLSGFGAVNLPYQQLATLLRTVPLSLVKSRERRARLTLKDIGQRKRRAAIAAAAAAAAASSSFEHGSSHHPTFGHGQGQARGDRRGDGDGSGGGAGLVARAMGAVTSIFSGSSSSSSSGSGGSSPFLSSQQAAAEADATASLEQIARELFLEISDCHQIQEQQRRAATLPGRVLVAFGAVMFVYCLLRLWKAGVSVLWAPPASSTSGVNQGGGFEGADGGVPGGEGTGDDPATRLVRFALSRHLLVDVDAEGWSELVSFVLIGVLVLLNTRGFLVTITKVSRASIISGFSIPAQVMSLLLSMLMGTYFTSSVILMRVNLPPRHRVAITAVLGGMRFSFYQRWFDTVFLLSGSVTAVTLLAFHLANRNSDADHLDDDGMSSNSTSYRPERATTATTDGRIDTEAFEGARGWDHSSRRSSNPAGIGVVEPHSDRHERNGTGFSSRDDWLSSSSGAGAGVRTRGRGGGAAAAAAAVGRPDSADSLQRNSLFSTNSGLGRKKE